MNAWTLLLAAGSILGIAASAAGQVRGVTLAWDPNQDSALAGYIVYVGNASGSYQEQYDAGRQTSFVYTKAVPGQPYFFSVAAYSAGRHVGPRSEEVLFLTSAPTATAFAASALGLESNVGTSRGDSAARARATASRDLCLRSGGCYRVEPLAVVAGGASALTWASDTRMFFVEGGKHVRVIEDGSLVPDAALTADGSSVLSGLALDPGFARTGHVYVGVIEGGSDGTRRLNIVRYRELANVFGEGAVIVAGLPLSGSGEASFTVDARRRLYVAMPDGSVVDSRAALYAGMVLRFESDGTAVREDGAGGPVFSPGHAQPTALAWTSAGSTLWLAGTGADGTQLLARLPLGPATAISDVASGRPSNTDVPMVFVLVDGAGGVMRVAATPAGAVTTPWIAPDELADRAVAALVGTSGDDIYVATTGFASQAVPAQIVRLRRQ